MWLGTIDNSSTQYTKSSRSRISGFYIVNNASAYDQGIYEAVLSWKYSEKCNNYHNQILNFGYTNGYYYYYNIDELFEMVIAKSDIRAEYYGECLISNLKYYNIEEKVVYIISKPKKYPVTSQLC